MRPYRRKIGMGKHSSSSDTVAKAGQISQRRRQSADGRLANAMKRGAHKNRGLYVSAIEERCPDRLTTALHLRRDSWNPVGRHARHRPGRADRGYGIVRFIEERCCDATDLDLQFLVVNRIPAAPHELKRCEQVVPIHDCVWRERYEMNRS